MIWFGALVFSCEGFLVSGLIEFKKLTAEKENPKNVN